MNPPSHEKAGPLAAVAQRIGRSWWLLLVAGVLWIVVGFVVLRFDSSTVAVISIVFGITALLGASGEVFRAVITSGGWRIWHVIFAILLFIGAIYIFVNPGEAFFSLALVIGFYFVFAGTFDVISSLFNTAIPGWWLQLLSGIAEIVLGLLASASYDNSVFILVTYVAFSAIFRGVSEVAAAFVVRSATASAA